MAAKRRFHDDATERRPVSLEPHILQDASKANISPSTHDESVRSTIAGQTPFASDASIVLIGIRGTGKSSLAFMASSALRFRVVDADQHFFHTTGLSRAAFNSKHGVEEYRQRELQVMHSILLDNQSRCVITCGPGSVEGKGQSLLKDYAKTHPVIYILRDTDDIQHYLHAWDAKTISNLVELTAPSYRASSSFEFYNISEYPSSGAEGTDTSSRSHPSLTLKNLQQDFLQLIYNVTSQAARQNEREARHTMSLLPPESRQFTYALSLPLSALTSVVAKLRDIESTADVIEFIVDLPIWTGGRRTFDNSAANNISKQFFSVRRYTRTPIIFQVPFTSPNEPKVGSLAEVDKAEQTYFELLHFGLRLAPEYICVDITCNAQRIKGLIAAKGSSKIIGHFFGASPGHNNGWATQGRTERLRQAVELGCDIVRLCQDATSISDNFSIQSFVYNIKNSDQPHRPLIAYNTGPLGRMSCWQNSTLTPVTHSLLRSLHPASTIPWLLTIQEAQTALYASFTLDRMHFSLVGSNVTSSLSPVMHNAAFKFCGMPHEYKSHQHSSLKEMEKNFHDPYFGGASITAPFKSEVMHLVTYMSREARAIGAVNTLVPLRSTIPDSLLERNRAGPIVAFYGENTDWIGMYTCVSRNLSPVNTVNARTTALVLGAGGMARAAVYAMIRLGVRKIYLQNRTLKKAEEVASYFNNWSTQGDSSATNLQKSDWDLFFEKVTNGTSHFDHRPSIHVLRSMDEPWPVDANPPTIVISSLPGRNLGNEVPINNTIPANWLASQTGGVVVELAYNPLETPLLKQIRGKSHQGWIVVDGLQILPEQGVPQFELFTGRKAPRQLMCAATIRGYEELHISDSHG